jgi:hypothetical protein
MYEVILAHAMIVIDKDRLRKWNSVLVNFVIMVQLFHEQGRTNH